MRLYIVGLSVLAILISFFSAREEGWWGGFLSNMGAGFAGSVATVILIEISITRKEKDDRRRRRTAAFERLRYPFLTHIKLLFDLHKAAALAATSIEPREIRDIFTDDYYET
jgi:hypothetical protein